MNKEEFKERDMDLNEEPEKDQEPVEEAEAETEETADTEEAAETEEKAGESEASEPAKKDPKDVQIEELQDKYRRLFAEFDNYRKRTDAEKAGRFADGESAVLLKTLDLLDNFERALANVPDDPEAEVFAEGIRMIYKQFMEFLKSFGVVPIESVGQPFDANYHNAVMHVEDENEPENTVVAEFQKGYLFNDKVLRYSMVKVAN